MHMLRALSCGCLPILAASLHAAQPQLILTADRTTAQVGETITITCSVADAPAFVCWGATAVLPASGLAATDQIAGTADVFVPDSRPITSLGVRFGGYAARPTFTSHPVGAYVLGRVTVVASAPGSYVIEAPAMSDSQPYGGVFLPGNSTERVVPLPASPLTLSIQGGGPVPGDLNADGVVDGADLVLFAGAYGTASGAAGFLPLANLIDAGTSAGRIDFDDLATFLALCTP